MHGLAPVRAWRCVTNEVLIRRDPSLLTGVDIVTPSGPSHSMTNAAFTLLGISLALYVAVRLLEAVEPVLVGLGIAVAFGYLLRLFFRRHNSGW